MYMNSLQVQEELGSILNSIGILSSQDLLHQMMAAMDTDGSGSVDFNEFLTMMTRMKAEMLRSRFKIFDKDGDGFISTEELKAVWRIWSFLSERSDPVD